MTYQRTLPKVVRSMVQKLPSEYRDALLLADFQGMKQAEIGQRLKISLSAREIESPKSKEIAKRSLAGMLPFRI